MGASGIDGTPYTGSAFPLLEPLHDAPYLVLRTLPPIFLEGPELQALASLPDHHSERKIENEPISQPDSQPSSQPESQPDRASRQHHASIEQLASLYREAARFELGLEVSANWPSLPQDPTYSLVRDIVLSRIGDQAARAAARTALFQRLNQAETPDWMATWCRTAIGRSSIIEPDAESKRRGVLQLLTVYVTYTDTDPNLAAIAITESARTLQMLRDESGSDRLWLLASESFPAHPALDELAVRRARLRAPRQLVADDQSTQARNGG